MKNTQDPSNDKQKPTTPPKDYRALLETTRPLVIVRLTRLSSRVPIYGDQATSLETDDCDGESVLKRGEIVCPDLSEQTLTGDEDPAGMAALHRNSSDLRIRIYIGMS